MRQAYGLARRAHDEALSAVNAREKEFERASVRIAAIDETLARLSTEHDETATRRRGLEDDMAALPDASALASALEQAREKRDSARSLAGEARAGHDARRVTWRRGTRACVIWAISVRAGRHVLTPPKDALKPCRRARRKRKPKKSLPKRCRRPLRKNEKRSSTRLQRRNANAMAPLTALPKPSRMPMRWRVPTARPKKPPVKRGNPGRGLKRNWRPQWHGWKKQPPCRAKPVAWSRTRCLP